MTPHTLALEACLWQPIETAPKDFTIILGFFPNYWIPGGDLKNPERTHCCACMRWDGHDDTGWYWLTLDGEANGEPTHWMPLPPPPGSTPDPTTLNIGGGR